MCDCGLTEGIHWYVDIEMAPIMFLVARSPEQAEHSLRSWAARILRKGSIFLDFRPMAAKILASKSLCLTTVCEIRLKDPSFPRPGTNL